MMHCGPYPGGIQGTYEEGYIRGMVRGQVQSLFAGSRVIRVLACYEQKISEAAPFGYCIIHLSGTHFDTEK